MELERAARLCAVDTQDAADAPAGLADYLEINQSAVGPMTMRKRNDAGRGINEVKHGGGPVIVGGPWHSDEARAGALGKIRPRIDVGGKLLGQRDDRLRL